MTQKTMTTVVDPIVSARLGNETFFNSARTSVMNTRIESVILLNITTPYHDLSLTRKNNLPPRQVPTRFILPAPGSIPLKTLIPWAEDTMVISKLGWQGH
jgi:hypothetical protein